MILGLYRALLNVSLSFLVLALIALLLLEPGSPSFIVDLFGIALLLAFITMLIATRRLFMQQA